MPIVQVGKAASMTEDTADRIRMRLDGTPEHVGDYLNGGEAVADMRALIAERDAALAQYRHAHAVRLATQERAALLEREVARLRAWVGYR